MNSLAQIMLFGWPLVQLALFAVMPSRRAVIVGIVAAWLLLPSVVYQALPVEISKASMATAPLLLGAILFDMQRISAFRPRWWDVPMLVWSFVAVVSSATNGLGAYDGLVVSFNRAFTWLIPYLIGRIYFDDWSAARELAIGIFIGGLLYVPLCLWEVRMSPHLHISLYGFSPLDINDVSRLGGFRPNVFMRNGLELGMWMASATLCGVWLWRTRSVGKLFGAPVPVLVAVQLFGTVMCRSLGALSLMVMGLALLWLCRTLRTAMPLVGIVIVIAVYLGGRASSSAGGELLLQGAEMIDPARAASLQFRLFNEDMLVQKALQQPIWGWAGWGRNKIFNEDGRDIAITDSLWIIVFGMHGVVGLTTVFAALLLPLVRTARRLPWRVWVHPLSGPGCVLSLVTALFTADCLFNAMVNPVYLIAAGSSLSLAGRAAIQSRASSRLARVPS